MQGHTKRITSSLRISCLLFATCLLLTGCQTTDFDQITSNIMDAITPSQTSTSASSTDDTPSEPKVAASEKTPETVTAKTQPAALKPSSVKWGVITLLVGGGGMYGDDWYLQVYPTNNTRNFVGVTGKQVTVAQTHAVQVWPGDYIVRVIHNSVTKFEKTVTISAGEMYRLTGEYGYFFNTIKTERMPVYNEQVIDIANRTSRVSENFLPIIVGKQGRWMFEFRGPQINGEIAGKGPITVLNDGIEVAKIPNAEVTPTEIIGRVETTDGGTFDAHFDRTTLDPTSDTTVVWKSGETFEGSLDVINPEKGKLVQLSGSVWEGEVENRQPTGKGRYTNTDGSWIEYENYKYRASYTGTRDCGPSPESRETCAFYKGEQLASEEELAAKIAEDKRLAAIEEERLAEQRRIEQIAAAKAAEEAAKIAEANRKAAAELAANQPVITKKADDCTTATGRFTADGDLTQYTMNGSGSGSGHFRQFTYGGSAQYQFDIDFRFSTTANSINFQYDQGVYRDASSGAVLQRTSIPGGSARCTFNGRVLTIDGKEFVKS